MNINKPSFWLSFLWLSLLVLTNDGCLVVQDGGTCTVAGQLQNGGLCSHLLTPATSVLSFTEFVAFLEPAAKTPTSPARGGAICMSSQDWGTMKTELETACRELGSKCSYATAQAIERIK